MIWSFGNLWWINMRCEEDIDCFGVPLRTVICWLKAKTSNGSNLIFEVNLYPRLVTVAEPFVPTILSIIKQIFSYFIAGFMAMLCSNKRCVSIEFDLNLLFKWKTFNSCWFNRVRREIWHTCFDAWHKLWKNFDEFIFHIFYPFSICLKTVSQYDHSVFILYMKEPVGVCHCYEVVQSSL